MLAWGGMGLDIIAQAFQCSRREWEAEEKGHVSRRLFELFYSNGEEQSNDMRVV